MRKLLYVAYKFPPVSTGDAARNMSLARCLPFGGWEMLPLTASNHRGLPEDDSLLEFLPEGMRVRRTYHPDPLAMAAGLFRKKKGRGAGTRGASADRPGSRLKRFLLDYILLPDRVITWGITAIPAGVSAARREGAELIMSFGPHHSVHMIALAIARISGLPCISHFGDLWMYDSLVDWNSRPEYTIRMNRRLESLTVRRSDALLTTTPLASDYFRRTYGSMCPPAIDIPNGYDPRFPGRGFAEDCPANRESSDTLRLVLTGFFLGLQTPEHILRGLHLFRERHSDAKVKLRFVGELRDDQVPLIDELGISHMVEITGIVPFHRVPEEQRKADALVVCLPPLPGSEVKNPSKLAEYLVSGKPILAVAPEGELTGTVREMKAGFSCEPVPEQIADTLGLMHRLHREGKLSVQVDPEAVAARFDMTIRCRDLGEFLNMVADRRSPSTGLEKDLSDPQA